jgi:hypothetical protein
LFFFAFVLVNQVQEYPVRGEVAFGARSFEDFSVNLFVEIMLEEFFFLETLEHLVVPKEVSSQTERLVNLEHKHDVRQPR